MKRWRQKGWLFFALICFRFIRSIIVERIFYFGFKNVKILDIGSRAFERELDG